MSAGHVFSGWMRRRDPFLAGEDTNTVFRMALESGSNGLGERLAVAGWRRHLWGLVIVAIGLGYVEFWWLRLGDRPTSFIWILAGLGGVSAVARQIYARRQVHRWFLFRQSRRDLWLAGLGGREVMEALFLEEVLDSITTGWCMVLPFGAVMAIVSLRNGWQPGWFLPGQLIAFGLLAWGFMRFQTTARLRICVHRIRKWLPGFSLPGEWASPRPDLGEVARTLAWVVWGLVGFLGGSLLMLLLAVRGVGSASLFGASREEVSLALNMGIVGSGLLAFEAIGRLGLEGTIQQLLARADQAMRDRMQEDEDTQDRR